MSVINMSLSIGHLMCSKMKVFTQQQVAIYITFRALQKHVLFFRTGNKFMFLLHMKNIDYRIRLNILSKKMIEIGYYSQWLRLYGMNFYSICFQFMRHSKCENISSHTYILLPFSKHVTA